MQTTRVNGYDMAYLEIGQGPPLVCIPRDARRLPHLVGGTRTAVKNASRDLGEPAAFFSRTLGRARRRLPDGASRCRRDRVYRETGYGAGGPDGAFPGRAHFVQGCRAAA